MPFQITVKVQDTKKVKNLKSLAQQLATVIESFTGKRTIVQIKEFSGVKR
jgi:hypothetical protein